MSPGGAAGGNQPLSNLVVQFVLQGQQQLQQALAGVQQQIGQVTSAINALGQQFQIQMARMQTHGVQLQRAVGDLNKVAVQGFLGMQASLERLITAVGQFHFDYLNKVGKTTEKTKEAKKPVLDLEGAFKSLAATVNVALGAGVASVTGFIHQGLAMGAMGQILQVQMQRLALTITGLFRPEIQRVSEWVQRLTNWIQSLSDLQRESIAHWLQAGAAALAMGLALPRVIAGLQGAAVAVEALGAALGFLEADTGIGVLIPLIGFAIQGMTLLMVGTNGGRDALASMWEATKPLVAELVKLGEALRLGDLLEALGNDFAVIVSATADAVRGLTALIKKFDELSNSKGIQVLHEIVRAGFLGGLADVLRQFGYNQTLSHVPGNRQMELARSPGFEDLEATYKRIAQASISASFGGKKPEERAADHLEHLDNFWAEFFKGLLLFPRPQIAR